MVHATRGNPFTPTKDFLSNWGAWYGELHFDLELFGWWRYRPSTRGLMDMDISTWKLWRGCQVGGQEKRHLERTWNSIKTTPVKRLTMMMSYHDWSRFWDKGDWCRGNSPCAVNTGNTETSSATATTHLLKPCYLPPCMSAANLARPSFHFTHYASRQPHIHHRLDSTYPQIYFASLHDNWGYCWSAGSSSSDGIVATLQLGHRGAMGEASEWTIPGIMGGVGQQTDRSQEHSSCFKISSLQCRISAITSNRPMSYRECILKAPSIEHWTVSKQFSRKCSILLALTGVIIAWTYMTTFPMGFLKK